MNYEENEGESFKVDSDEELDGDIPLEELDLEGEEDPEDRYH